MAGEVGKVSLARTGGLDDFVKKAREWGGGVNVGFLDSDIAQIAAWNEYGVSITVSEKMRKWFLAQGLAAKAQDPSVDMRMYSLQVGKVINIPPRPFMQRTIDKNSKDWGKTLKAIVDKMGDPTKLDKGDIEQALGILGAVIVGQIKDSISSGEFVSNSPFTVQRKGKNTPLQDTGKLMQSVDYEVTSK
jgi:hypothetical protein